MRWLPVQPTEAGGKRTPLSASVVRLIRPEYCPNAIHLSNWTGQEVPLDFNDDDDLAELNSRIRDEGLFQQRV
jgi:hypothetical protein